MDTYYERSTLYKALRKWIKEDMFFSNKFIEYKYADSISS